MLPSSQTTTTMTQMQKTISPLRRQPPSQQGRRLPSCGDSSVTASRSKQVAESAGQLRSEAGTGIGWITRLHGLATPGNIPGSGPRCATQGRPFGCPSSSTPPHLLSGKCRTYSRFVRALKPCDAAPSCGSRDGAEGGLWHARVTCNDCGGGSALSMPRTL